MVVPCYENGDTSSNNNPVIVHFNYNDTGASPMPTKPATFSAANLGTTWGIAYQASTKQVFAGSMLKRHSTIGPRGADGIYVLDYTNSAAAVLAGGFDLQGVTPSNGGAAIDLGSVTRNSVGAGAVASGNDNGLSTTNTQPSWDLDAFDKVGKMSYGDIDVTEDGRTLWAVNLFQRTLIAVDISSPITNLASNPNTLAGSLVRSYNIVSGGGQTISGAPSCTSGQLRPWGLAFRNGVGYLGAVCDASGSATRKQSPDQRAYVLSFDPANPTSFTTVVNFALDYSREPAHRIGALATTGLWQRWTNTWSDVDAPVFANFTSAPQPILSDITFTDDGSMVIGLADRFGHQAGWGQYQAISTDVALRFGVVAGDVIRAQKQGSSFVVEGTGVNDIGIPGYPGFLNTDGPNGVGEFFYGDFFVNTAVLTGDGHYETGNGGLTTVYGKGEVAQTSLDPLAFFSQGVRYFNTSTGALARGYEVVGSTGTSNLGKGGGIGDIEALCSVPSIEVGNRIWMDADNDGVQDAGEMGISGVAVQLIAPDGTTVLDTVTTDSNGNYYFSNGAGTNTASERYNIAGLTASTTGFKVRIPNASGGSQQAVLAGKVLASANADATAGGDLRDSDASQSGTNAEVTFNTGASGSDDHTFDIGFLAMNCTVAGATTVCNGSTNTYTVTTNPDPLTNPVYSWTISTAGGSNATITGATNGTSVMVNSGTNAGSYTVMVSITSTEGSTSCTLTATI
ncbi:MAG: SdrD B-like domain-containing protein, partial [Acidobacteriota bacterium]